MATRPLRTATQTGRSIRPISERETRNTFYTPWPKNLPDGNCKAYSDADVFSSPSTEEELATAKAVCRTCPIQVECLLIGRERKEEGVYGGILLFNGKPSPLPKDRKRGRKDAARV